HLLLEHFRLVQAVLRGELDELLVRNAAPEEERQARGELDIADAIWRTGRDVRGLELRAIDELRIREQALHDGLDAVVEAAAFFAAGVEERHHRLEVGTSRGAAERFARERRDDRPRALGLLAALRGIALEDLVAALRALGDLAVERPFDEHLANVRVERVARDRARRVHRTDERLVEPRVGQIARRDERDAHSVEARLDRDLRRAAAVAFLRRDLLVPVIEIHAR